MSLPFQETKLQEKTFIREFKYNTESSEFIWHRDMEDRIVEPLHDTNWMLQIEDQLPRKLEGEIFIPMGTYHRLIKGTGDLKIKLQKLI